MIFWPTNFNLYLTRNSFTFNSFWANLRWYTQNFLSSRSHYNKYVLIKGRNHLSRKLLRMKGNGRGGIKYERSNTCWTPSSARHHTENLFNHYQNLFHILCYPYFTDEKIGAPSNLPRVTQLAWPQPSKIPTQVCLASMPAPLPLHSHAHGCRQSFSTPRFCQHKAATLWIC